MELLVRTECISNGVHAYLLTINLKDLKSLVGVYYIWLRLAQGHGSRSIKKDSVAPIFQVERACLENQHLYLWYFSSGITADINLPQ